MKFQSKMILVLLLVTLPVSMCFAILQFNEHIVTDDFGGAHAVWLTDMDQDDDMDIVGVASSANTVSWFENDDLEFTEHVIDDNFAYAHSVHTVDMDDDGDIDVIACARNSDTLSWFENDGDMEFTAHIITDVTEHLDYPRYVQGADLDGDDDIDVFATSDLGYDVKWFENDGDENFTYHIISDSVAFAYAGYAIDLDNDDDIDVIRVSQTVGYFISWWENDGDGNFGDEITIDNTLTDGRGVFACDMDGDDDIDVLGTAHIAAGPTAATVAWYENDGDQDFERHIITDELIGAWHSWADDLDGDNDIDVISVGEESDSLVIFENDGDMNFTEHLLAEEWDGAIYNMTGDIDGDGDADIIAAGFYNHTISWFENLEQNASITGTITDSETGEPVDSAIITMGFYIDTTDVDGHYGADEFFSSFYTVTITKEGYGDYVEEDVELEEGDNEIDFEITVLSGDLTGVVTDELTEELLEGVNIECIDTETNEIFREVLTNDLGEYIVSLHDGVTYRIIATMDGYAPSDTAEKTIRWDREQSEDFELTPVFARTIRELQQEQDPETWISTTGIVTQGTNVTDTEHTNIYIQDDSDWGIQLWDDTPWDHENNINRGDEITVIGFLIEEDDITSITNFVELVVIDNDNPLPDPLIESTGDMSRNAQREGTWAQMSGQINRDPPGEGSYTLIADDGSGQCALWISETAALDLSAFSADDWGTFTGVISLTRQGLRLIPNDQDDIERTNINVPSELLAETEVVWGGPLQLDVVLSWTHDNLDDFIRFKIYRDDEHIGNTQESTWSEKLVDPNPGEYETHSWIYTVTAVYDEGETEHSNEEEVIWDITSVGEHFYSGIPVEWALEAVYPNPFNPTVTAVIGLPLSANLTVKINNILGEQLAVLGDGLYAQGYHKFVFDAHNLSSGIYFIQATVPDKLNVIRKVVLVR
ncbi:MAG: FG-GAP-like repeat-containing protein [Candidatus Electryonea clarkiae]|nr:FG-GAP-like repeat-containing protein [Candidatus Electryonea clarkiae]MDP8289001.1 FG-GAP-like repeat-containing protein [Candidatus Electryonea clarkiae]